MSDTQRFDNSGDEAIDMGAILRGLLGVGLIFLSVCLLLWLVVSLVGLIDAETPPALVAALSPGESAPLVITAGETDISLPQEVINAAGYLFACFVYVLAAAIVSGMLRGGVHLLQPDFIKTLKQILRDGPQESVANDLENEA